MIFVLGASCDDRQSDEETAVTVHIPHMSSFSSQWFDSGTGNQTAFGWLNPANLALFVSEDFRLSRAKVVSCLKIRLW